MRSRTKKPIHLTNIRLINDNVMIEPEPDPKVSDIIEVVKIQSRNKKSMFKNGIVRQIGNGLVNSNGQHNKLNVSVGDRVIYSGAITATPIVMNNTNYDIVTFANVFAVR